MEKANLEYLKLANNILKSYNGKPEGLASFLNCLDLLKTITPPELTSLALSFIKTRLEGRALDSIPQSYVSIDELKVALTNNIKPISSKLLESRLSATSSSKKTLQEFVGAIENAASLLKQSLVTEGCSSKKAEELVTARVLEICRSSTQSEFLKTVLASSTFNNYQDVINKYCLESTQSGLNNNTSVLLMQRSYRSAVPGSNFRYQNPHNFNYSNAGLSRFNTPNYQTKDNNHLCKIGTPDLLQTIIMETVTLTTVSIITRIITLDTITTIITTTIEFSSFRPRETNRPPCRKHGETNKTLRIRKNSEHKSANVRLHRHSHISHPQNHIIPHRYSSRHISYKRKRVVTNSTY